MSSSADQGRERKQSTNTARRSTISNGRPRVDSLEVYARKSRQVVVPWSQMLLTGVPLLKSASHNKGEAFTTMERKMLRLDGLLPPRPLAPQLQVERVFHNLTRCAAVQPAAILPRAALGP
jgi:hypothetical protein